MNGKNFALASLVLVCAGTAFAVSPHFAAINSTLKGLKNANVDCSEYKDSDPKKGECEKCKQGVDEQKGSVPGKVTSAQAKDAALEKTAAANAAGTAVASTGSNRGSMNSDKGNKSGGKEAKQGQATNFADLAKALKECKDKVEQSCTGEMAQKGEEAKNACEQAAQQAQTASAESGAQAEQMAKDEKKNDDNGKGMEPPKMPEMPKQDEKPKAEAPKSDVTTPEKIAGSNLSGNQLGGNKVGIGGEEPKSADAQSNSPFHPGAGASFDSGISTSHPDIYGAGAGATGGSRNSSGSSSAGGFGGGGSSESGSAANGAAAMAGVPKPVEDIEAFSNGSSRPSYLGMKSKGGELADLGLDGAAANALDASFHGADGDRSLANTEQNSGIHTEDDGSSIFNMVRSRIKEIGRRGSI